VTKLYLHIYLTVLASLLAFALISGATWRLLRDLPELEDRFSAIRQIADLAIPPRGAAPAEIQAALDRLHERFDADLALFGREGRLLGHVGPVPPPPKRLLAARRHEEMERRGRAFRHEDGPDDPMRPQFNRGRFIAPIVLADGRILVVQRSFGWLDLAPRIVIVLTLSALAVGLAAFPLARRLTRRLEALKLAVDEFGAGKLDARAALKGRDEVATLAASFNQAADRIQALMAARKVLLANASHELRSPLARLTMATQLLPDNVDPKRQEEIARNIAELDQLVGEILLASQLDADSVQGADGEVDLLALVAEEAASFGADVAGAPIRLRGDARLLSRMTRNLLENARRYGGGSKIEVALERTASGFQLSVADRGPGVPEAQRERIFEPFYRVPDAPEREGGVGLGLSLVRQIASRHNATVHCEAREGGGLRFIVTFQVD
jgi:signal transduction histidine kinase